MKIQILGTGCPKCRKLAENTEAAARELGIDYTIEKVTDIARFADFGVMVTPAMAVDGDVRVVGRVPAIEELKTLLV